MLKLCSYESVNDKGKHLFHLTDTSTDMTKIAGVTLPQDVTAFLSSYKPSGSDVDTYVTSAMGAGEHYGPNLNGDWFPQDMLERRHPTFVSHGKFFKYHQNKSYNTSYGKVVFATYDKQMHKVVLIVEVYGDKLPDVKSRYDKGDPVFVSMGCAVPYDTCSICGNRAKTPANYCNHLTTERLRIRPDGKMPYMINPDGTFFDISYVIIPADRTAFFMHKLPSSAEAARTSLEADVDQGGLQKAASLHLVDLAGQEINTMAKAAELFLTGKTEVEVIKMEKTAAVEKAAVDKQAADKLAADKVALMIKRIVGAIDGPRTEEANRIIDTVGHMRQAEPEMDEPLIKVLSRHPVGKVLMSLLAAGVILKPREFQRLLLRHAGMDDACDLMDRHGAVIAPQDAREIGHPIGIDMNEESDLYPEIVSLANKYLGDKSFAEPMASRRIMIIKTGSGVLDPFAQIPIPLPPTEAERNRPDPLMRYFANANQPNNQWFPNAGQTPDNKARSASVIGGLAAMYLGYLLQSAAAAASLSSPTAKAAGPLGAILKILGGAAAATAGSELMFGAAPKQASMEKSAILKSLPSIAAGTLASIGLQTAFQEADRDRYYSGQQPNTDFLRNQIKLHPVISGVAGGLLMEQLPVIRDLVRAKPFLTAAGLAAPFYLMNR